MNKKAATHVDWAVSMSIFLIYLLSLLIFLKPGSEPIYKEDRLINNLLSSIKKDAYYTIDKTPLYISLTNVENSGYYKSAIYFKPENKFPFTGLEQNFALLNSSNDIIYFRFTKTDVGYTLNFYENFRINDINSFYLLYSQPLDYTKYTMPPAIDAEEIYYKSQDPEENNFTYTFGISESFSGISISNFSSLVSNIEETKTLWNYPKNKNFKLTLINSTSFQYTKDDILIENATAKEEKNVFVKEWKDYILEKDTKLKPVTINLRIW